MFLDFIHQCFKIEDRKKKFKIYFISNNSGKKNRTMRQLIVDRDWNEDDISLYLCESLGNIKIEGITSNEIYSIAEKSFFPEICESIRLENFWADVDYHVVEYFLKEGPCGEFELISDFDSSIDDIEDKLKSLLPEGISFKINNYDNCWMNRKEKICC